jgi:hypothetical protein
MGALLDVALSMVVFMIGFLIGPVYQINSQNIDFNTAHRTQLMLQKAIDRARTQATTVTATPGMLDNDGTTIVIAGAQLTIYPERPVGSATIGSPETIYLPSTLTVSTTNTNALTTTFFVAPNGNITMQDNFTVGSVMNPSAGCPHATFGAGTHYTISVDCTTGETKVSG